MGRRSASPTTFDLFSMSTLKNFLNSKISDQNPIRLIYHRIIGMLAAFFYRFPAENMRVIAVTGTNGKTTVVSLIAAILEAAGKKVGVSSSVNFQVGSHKWINDTKQTTLGRFALQKLLRQMADTRCDCAILEVTSHAITQSRLWGINVDTAVLTNVYGDHIEYHGDFKEYLHAKGKLFEGLNRARRKPNTPKIAVLNRDDPNFEYFEKFVADRTMLYGLKGGATCYATDIELKPNSTSFDLNIPNNKVRVNMSLPGIVNVYNALAASAVSIAHDVSLSVIKSALERFSGVPGRMESIDEGQEFAVIVDYAHTPYALEKLLSMFKNITKGRLIAVFGATGGGRDKRKRPIMGRIADRYADMIVLTDDDPYLDERFGIIEDIAKGINREEGEGLWKIVNRREAIRFALDNAKEGDTVVITGKGCEPIQMIGGKRIPWDDRKVVKEILNRVVKVEL